MYKEIEKFVADNFNDILLRHRSIVQLTRRNQLEGFEQGRKAGTLVGEKEGNKLGWQKGAAIGSEVGFYAGFAKSLLEEMSKNSESKTRSMKTLEKLVSLAEDFPLSDPLHPELQTKLEEIRTKFKQMCSQLGIKPEVPSSSENTGISF